MIGGSITRPTPTVVNGNDTYRVPLYHHFKVPVIQPASLCITVSIDAYPDPGVCSAGRLPLPAQSDKCRVSPSHTLRTWNASKSCAATCADSRLATDTRWIAKPAHGSVPAKSLRSIRHGIIFPKN